MYLSALTSAWSRIKLKEPSLWLARDPDSEAKMLRDADIGQAVQHRTALVAGREWQLAPMDPEHPAADLAVAVGTKVLEGIKKFTDARQLLSRAFFHGKRYAQIHSTPRTLDIGDGVPRTWIVPTRLEDQSSHRYRKVVPNPHSDEPSAFWERWDVLSSSGGRWVPVTRREAIKVIGHVFLDDEAGLGYGKGLREQLGWPWYALTHVNQEAIGAIEKFARGWVHAKVDVVKDSKTSLPNTEVVKSWLRAIENMQSRGAIVSTQDDEIEVKEGSGTGWEMIDRFRASMTEKILKLVLSAHLPTGASEGGSFALGAVQENSTEMLVQTDRQRLEETLTDDLLGFVWFSNWPNLVELGIQDQKPRFSIVQEKREDPKEVAETAATLNGMNVPLAADDIYERTGFRKPEPGEDVIEPAPPPQPSLPFGGGGFGEPPPFGQESVANQPQPAAPQVP